MRAPLGTEHAERGYAVTAARQSPALAQFIQPPLQEAPFRLELRQGQRCSIGIARLVQAAQLSAEVGACRVQQVIVVQSAAGLEVIQLRQARRWAVAHGQRDGPVQLDGWGRADTEQGIVEPDDLRPVGLLGRKRFGVHGDDRRLQRIGAQLARNQRSAYQRQAFGDGDAVPRPRS